MSQDPESLQASLARIQREAGHGPIVKVDFSSCTWDGSFAQPCDVTLPSKGADFFGVAFVSLLALVTCGWTVFMMLDYEDPLVPLFLVGPLVPFLVVCVVVLAAPLWSGRPGSVVCAPDGLHYVRRYRSRQLPWATIDGVDVEEKLDGSPETGRFWSTFSVRVHNRLHPTTLWIRLDETMRGRTRAEAEYRAEIIEAWRTNFAPPAV